MTLTKSSLSNPVAVIVAVLLAILFGALNGWRLPVQLTPEVEKPEISISTKWRAAAPHEVESEIIEPQENVLRGLPGMVRLESQSQRGQGRITITFAVGTDLRRALIEVLNNLNRVPQYPDDAEEPVIRSIGGRARAIAWFIVKPGEGNTRDISSYNDFLEEVVQTRFERIPGVAQSEVRGGREKEVRIIFDPYKAASLGVELPKVAMLAGSAKDISAGFTEVGKRRYTVRFSGAYSVDELKNMVLDWRDGEAIRLQDLATVEVALKDRTRFVIQNGEPAMAVNAYREIGVNVLDVMDGLKQAVKELEQGALKRANLTIKQVYDETRYIDRSIDMVEMNLVIGVFLAVAIMWWFFRKFRATVMVALAIPTCIISAFIFLNMFGRSINVISLAGLAFAVGMVLDAAIVVLESIVRLRERGMEAEQASMEGTEKVWGALLASTATTAAIFLPVVFLRDEVGQLFADLALTIAVAVCLSLVVAVTVLPTAAMTWLRKAELSDPHEHWWINATALVMRLTDTPARRWTWIIVLITLPLLSAYLLLPEADYLPQGKRNLVFASILPPPGTNVDTLEKELAKVVAKRMQPYVDGSQQPAISDYFFVASETFVFMGARTRDPGRSDELIPIINKTISGFPDTIAFARRASLFSRSSGDTIDIDIHGRDIASLLDAAVAGFSSVRQNLGRTPRPRPGLSMAEPELLLLPDERRIAEAGWNRASMSSIVRSVGDGLYVGDYFDGEQRLDILLRSTEWGTPEQLASLPLSTPNSGVLPLGELVKVKRSAGPNEIRRINRRRTITLEAKPPAGMPLEQAMNIIKAKVVPEIEALLPEDGEVELTGRAADLESAKRNMAGIFILAAIILYLLMAALFRSFWDSFLVILALPGAAIGGILGLSLTNLLVGQAMDTLTMIGFVILLGLVVNNAILLMHYARRAEREGVPRRQAVEDAVHLRLRPILMSTLTSLLGMLPLLINPGAGSELYRGLASVIVGGMTVSTIFTLVLLPSILRLGEGRRLGENPAISN